jgi:hypothetical protein
MSLKFCDDYLHSTLVERLVKLSLGVTSDMRINTPHPSKNYIIMTKFQHPLFKRPDHPGIQGEGFIIIIDGY